MIRYNVIQRQIAEIARRKEDIQKSNQKRNRRMAEMVLTDTTLPGRVADKIMRIEGIGRD